MATREDFEIFKIKKDGETLYCFQVEYYGVYFEPSLCLILKKRREIKKEVKEKLAWIEKENKKYYARLAEEQERRALLLKEAKEEEIKILKQLLTDLTPAQEKERQRQLANQKKARTRLCYAMMDSGMSNEDILLTTDIPAAVVSRIRIEFNKRKK